MNNFKLLSEEMYDNIFYNCDKDSLLLIATVCKDFKNYLKKDKEKLILSTKYITSSLSLALYAHKYFKHDFKCINSMDPKFSCYGYRQCSTAAEKGCHLCLGYAKNMGCSWDTNTSSLAARNNNIKCLKYCLIYGCKLNPSTCYWAAYTGNLDILIFCHINNVMWNALTCQLSAEMGHLNCLKYAREHDCPWNRDHCRRLAAENGHQHIVDWINEI